MPQQRMYTAIDCFSRRLLIVWTRGPALARSWASRYWAVDPVFVDIRPTDKVDQEIVQRSGEKEHYA